MPLGASNGTACHAALAQSAERLTRNEKVISSILIGGSTLEASIHADAGLLLFLRPLAPPTEDGFGPLRAAVNGSNGRGCVT